MVIYRPRHVSTRCLNWQTLGDTPGHVETIALAAILAVTLTESVAATRGHERQSSKSHAG